MSGTLSIGVVGGSGWLGGAVVQAMLDAQLTVPELITLSYRSRRPARFQGVHWTQDNQELVDRSDVIIVSVRPIDWPAVRVVADGKLAISAMAGIRLDRLAEQLKTGRVVRALPNAAAEVGKSYTPWAASAGVSPQDRSIVRRIFDACGTTDEVASEADLDYLTGLSGSGPAFPALLATAMIKDAVAHGISPEIARRAAAATLVGAGRLLELHAHDPEETVDAFVDYRGAIAAAIAAMRAAGFESAVGDGLAAAFRKTVSMGQAS